MRFPSLRVQSLRVVAAALGAVVVVVGGALALAGRDDTTARAQGPEPTAVPTTAAAPTLPPTTAAPATTTTEPPPATSEPGSPEVLALQQKLAALGYDVGEPDGKYGTRTYFAVMAFQKIQGLPADGQAGSQVMATLASAVPPGPIAGGEPNRVEIDLDRQVLLLWQGGRLARILPVSSGNGQWYCTEGECDVATTPTGTFRIGRKYPGAEVSKLGELYSPSYFYLGWAIHGSPSVPPYPASHGCVRIPMYAAASFYDQVPTGTQVVIVGTNPPTGPPPPEALATTSTTTVPEAPPTTAPPFLTIPSTIPPTTAPPTTAPATTTTTVPPATTTTSTTVRATGVP